jgi:hypothetical protein
MILPLLTIKKSTAIDIVSIYCDYLVKDTTNQQMKALWKWNSDEIVSQYIKMVFVAHLQNKMRFTYRNFKFKIPLNCTDGTTLPQYGIYKKQNTGTKLNKSISFAHNIHT